MLRRLGIVDVDLLRVQVEAEGGDGQFDVADETRCDFEIGESPPLFNASPQSRRPHRVCRRSVGRTSSVALAPNAPGRTRTSVVRPPTCIHIHPQN